MASDNLTTVEVAGLLAEFRSPDALRAAAARVRAQGFTRWDTYSPFPIHGMERAMGIRMTPLPWLVLAAGIAGAGAALLLQWATNAWDYPHITSGKPIFSLPANIPIIFELVVLFSALAAFLGTLAINRLPLFSHPVFSVRRFHRVTTDGFFLAIDATDPQFDPAATEEFLRSLGAQHVEVLQHNTAGREFPKAIFWAGAVAAVLAVLPPLLIARARAIKSDKPRIHLIFDMDFQPRYAPQAASPLFADGRAMRPPVPGTVARGDLEADSHLYRGISGGGWAKTFPMPVTRSLMERGRERFNIYCSVCHGLVGEGDGMTAKRAIQRGEQKWVPPLSLHTKGVREQSVGQLFNTVTHGVRTMPAYDAQIPVADRWAIVLYIRALQQSQNAGIEDVPEEVRRQLR